MSKDSGFLLYKREENALIAPEERVQNFCEFHAYLNEEKRKEQASRCMNCGVPMCQSAIKLSGMVTGCPLHNLIPEWNEALSDGSFEIALRRLLATSSFPEFTGRVCPALCEKACNCGSLENSEAVTVHDNELFIIEKAFKDGLMKARVPKVRTGKRVAVVGSGPSGLALSDMLNRRGHSVVVYEREDKPGGLLMYGIPNMKLDKSIIERRINLMKEEGVVFRCNENISSKDCADSLLNEYDAVALCCGAKNPRGLNVNGSSASGVLYAVDFLTSVTKSLVNSSFSDKNFFDPKDKDVVIVGGGDTGNDCTGTCIRLGAKSVTQLEMMKCPPKERGNDNPWPQWPKVLKTDYGQQEAIALYGSDPRIYETTIKEIHTDEGHVSGVTTVQVEFKTIDGKRTLAEVQGSEKELPCDLILIAAGFVGCEPYTPEAFGLELSTRGTVVTEEDGYKTSASKVFSAGDMRRGQSLVVWAISEGRACAREIDQFLMGYSNL